jgi:hypothetical protein
MPNAHSDIERWSAFLLSNAGGAWREEEVISLVECDRNALAQALSTFADIDYSVVVFTGQGKMVKGKLPWSEAEVVLCTGDIVTERELNPGTPSCTLVFDCWGGESAEKQASAEVSRAKDLGDPEECRSLYDKSIVAAERGLVRVYAFGRRGVASLMQSFSQRLLDAAYQWATENRGILSIPEGLSLVVQENEKQNIEYRGGRRQRDFPLAVSS